MIPPSNSSAEQHRSFRTTFLILCTVVPVLFFGWMLHTNQQAQLPVVNQARVAENKAAIKLCRSSDLCIGGFVKFLQNAGGIARIGYCGNNCQPYEIGITQLVRYKERISPEQFLTQFEVILPNDRSKWEAVAIEYSRQFVIRQ